MNTILLLASFLSTPASAWNGVSLDQTYDPYSDTMFLDLTDSTPQVDLYGSLNHTLLSPTDVYYGPAITRNSCFNTIQVANGVQLSLDTNGGMYDLDAVGTAWGDGTMNLSLSSYGLNITMLAEDGGYTMGLANTCGANTTLTYSARSGGEQCFFQHVCRELCNGATSTGRNVKDGGSGYVLGCIVAETYFKVTSKPSRS